MAAPRHRPRRSFDRALCIYDTEKLDKGRDAFRRVRGGEGVRPAAMGAGPLACAYMLRGACARRLQTAPPQVRDCARAAITSLALDARAGALLAGSLDGCLRVWSLEGRCLDKFEGLAARAVSAAHVPQTNVWWATGRFERVNVCDPRAPANVTAFTGACNHLTRHQARARAAVMHPRAAAAWGPSHTAQ